MLRRKYLEALAAAFFLVVILVVLQQIYTSMTEQGIASGGPYDNAAAYPLGVAILIGVLLVAQYLSSIFLAKPNIDKHATEDASEAHSDDVSMVDSFARPALMLGTFAIYLALLEPLGYHLTTTPMLFCMMLIGGVRNLVIVFASALALSFSFAFMFEFFLKIVLPGGMFALNIAW